MSYGMNSGALSRAGKSQLRTIFALAVTAAALLALSIAASSASAAFNSTGFSLQPSSTQAGGHPAVTINAANDPVGSDALKNLDIDLPAGMQLNPQAVASPCSTASFNSDSCAASTYVGSISVSFRAYGNTYSANGAVYSITPDNNSLINFGFIVRPSGFQKFFFTSGRATGLATVRQGLDADYGLSISVPNLPRSIQPTWWFSTSMAITNISITFNSRANASQNGKYFAYAPTRCNTAVSRATLTSYAGSSASRTSSFTPTGCDKLKFDPDFSITPSNTVAGHATGVSATVTMPTAEQSIQQSHVSDIVVDLPAGTTLNLPTLNALTECSESQLAADNCPASSRMGSASANVPFLPSAMTGDIYLTAFSGVKFGYVLRGARGTIAILRGAAQPVSSGFGGATIEATFQALPQVPWSSATLNFSSAVLNNPKNSCPNAVSWADIKGHSGARLIYGTYYPQTACPPDTAITSTMGSVTRLRQPTFTFTSTPAGASFECSIDYGTYEPCTSGFKPSSLADGAHTFGVRAVNDGVTDPSPALVAFTVDATPPPITITSPAQDEVLTSGTLNASFTTEPGAVVYCWTEDSPLTTCTSPATFAGLADGAHTFTVYARDAAGNLNYIVHDFTVAVPKKPIVNLTSPLDQGTTQLDNVVPIFTVNSPTGAAITKVTCSIFVVYYKDFEYPEPSYDPGVPCESGDDLGLSEGDKYRIQVDATDENGLTGFASATFTTGIRAPSHANVVDADDVSQGRITDRTPSFGLEPGDARWPNTTYECSLTLKSAAPVWTYCGTRTELPPYVVTEPLADGEWSFMTRGRSGDVTGFASTMNFTVGPWSAVYEMIPSTTVAGAHPDLDVKITPDESGQLRTVDMTLPKGLIGSLTAFPKCPAANVATANCAAETEMGDVEVDYQIAGLSGLKPTDGSVFFTEAQSPGDVAGLVVRVNSPVPPFADVIIPLRVQLTNNAQEMRIFSDSIPTVVGDINKPEKFTNFWVNEFIMHVHGSEGSPYPLLTNPSSCAAGQFSATFGDTQGTKTAPASIPLQATDCASLPFNPAITQTFSSTAAGTLSGISASVSIPTNNSSFRILQVTEPPAIGPNFPSFGASEDQCPASAAPTSNSMFDPSGCPASALVGTMTILSPLLDVPLEGKVYLINRSPLPWLGVALDGAGVHVRLVGSTGLPQVDPTCDPLFDPSGACATQIQVTFGNLPDLQATNISFSIDGPDRTTAGGNTLSGKILTIAQPNDNACVPSAAAKTIFLPNSGTAPVSALQTFAFAGCSAH